MYNQEMTLFVWFALMTSPGTDPAYPNPRFGFFLPLPGGTRGTVLFTGGGAPEVVLCEADDVLLVLAEEDEDVLEEVVLGDGLGGGGLGGGGLGDGVDGGAGGEAL